MSFLKDLYNILPVHPVKVVPEAVYGARQTGSAWEGALTLTDAARKYEFVGMGEILILAEQKPVPPNQRLVTLKASEVGCQGYIRDIHSAVWTHNTCTQALPVCCALPCAAPF